MNIIVSMGDCNGIGLEVFFKAILNLDNIYLDKNYRKFHGIGISLSGNNDTINEYFAKAGYSVEIESNNLIIGDRTCPIIPVEPYSPVEFGSKSIAAGKLAIESIEAALGRTIAGEFDAFVTMPISKDTVKLAGFAFPGHTEMIAGRCNSPHPNMILCTSDVRVSVATIHTALSNVPQMITTGGLTGHIQRFRQTLIEDFNISAPTIAVLGLNPHAGEDGAFGNEETDIIIPAIRQSVGSGIEVDGPFPADGFFAHGTYKNYDGIIAMYHDQGLIPLKLLAEGAGVNFTAGLPIVRTSPDHGTAFNIAGRNLADEKSVVEAIKLAIDIARARGKR